MTSSIKHRTLGRNRVAGLLVLLLLIAGCHRARKTTSAPNTTDFADNLRAVVAQTQLSVLRWPDYSDYQPQISAFYNDRNFEIAWLRNGKPTSQATAFIQAFQEAAAKGLEPEDYDASRWPARLDTLAQIDAGHNTAASAQNSSAQDSIAQFDVAMSICVMRYISDLRIGRVNPRHFNFGINVAAKKYDLAEFVSDNAVDAGDVPRLIQSVEPDSDQYRATEAALARYLDMAHRQAAANQPPLPEVQRPISVGAAYPAASQLLTRLVLEGDLPAANLQSPTDVPAPSAADPAPSRAARRTFDRTLSDGVKLYQHRHALTEDGRLTSQTVKSLNVPLTSRVLQLQDSLERWRWLPDQYVNAPLIVNLPEFVLRGYDSDHKVEFTMKVVVGKALDNHDTPVLAQTIKYLIFRPYWKVPVDIARTELAPHMERSGVGYLASKNFEVTNARGDVLPRFTAQQVANGNVLVREKPGPKNSLGLIKFMFPNPYDIYLHSTPAPELFERSRRDFSHGCVRVQKPDELAAWVFQNGGLTDWDIDRVRDAMDNGPNNHQVNLKTPIPIVIFYVTAIAADDGDTHFFDDIYGYDQKLQEVLAKGPPYPVQPDPTIPTPQPGDTL